MSIETGGSSDGRPYPEKIRGISVVPEPSRERLGERELIDYGQHRTDLLRWAFDVGKNPDRAEGYAQQTVFGRAYRLDQFSRWVWDEYDGYTTNITHSYADDYTRYLVRRDGGDEDKSNHQKAIKMLFKWKAWNGTGETWNPDVTINSNSGTTNPADFFTIEERSQIRETLLSFDSVPNYSSCSPEQRDRIKQHLAQRFEKPKRDVTPEDFERANSWQLPSLFWTALDTGLRPIEVRRANVSWVDIDNNVLRIPKDESSKNSDN
ncbi:site-specific integrase [Halapricum desulfuricans]|uniref:XerD/XerC family integrase n=1 Tax=Halapricum desulfuricans TaxID=2841257 RepID=A0A897NBT7_9EURY|nr:site-specific recombinase xerd [Halapricum desulfuricans]QSG08543.1 XerD/XerC family integrase [Halapricum desulfuricans]